MQLDDDILWLAKEDKLGKALQDLSLKTVSYTHLDVYKRQVQALGYIPTNGAKKTKSRIQFSP